MHSRPLISFEHVPKLICAQHMFSKCGAVDDLSVDCEQRGNRIQAFWQDSVVKFIDYLMQSRPFANMICHFKKHSLIQRTVSS